MTYGGNGYLCASDGDYMENDLFQQFSTENCPSLHGKPKIFLLHTSQKDENNNHGVKSQKLQKDENNNHGAKAQKLQNDGFNMCVDTLIMHSTQPNSTELLEENGSWFSQALSTELRENRKQQNGRNIFDILLNMNNWFSQQKYPKSGDNRRRQCPSFTSTLSKTFLLKIKTMEHFIANKDS